MSVRRTGRQAALALPLCCALVAPAAAQQPVPAGAPRITLPATAVGQAVGEWMETFNTGDTAQLRAFYRKFALERAMGPQVERFRTTGGYELVSVEKSEPRLLELVLKERATGRLTYSVMELAAPGGVPGMTQTYLFPIPNGGSVADFKIDAAGRARVLEAAIARLDSNYVFPEVASRMADTARARLARGAYDNVTNGISFARLLTQHFQEVSKDKHLQVNFVSRRIPDRPADARPDAEELARYREQLLADNCGFVRSEVLEGNVGYLKFNFFADRDICGPAATRAMTPLADVDALIVDMRENGGGSPGMVAYVSSYLFSKRTHLNDLWTRRTNATQEFWTQPDVPGRKVGDHVPIYVLTSSRTFSGAEEFSYNLKNLKRATIVGETTGGGAHPVSGHKIDDHFMIGVPFARAINPISRTNWEGVGVEPDVKVPASDALATAQRMIRERKATP